MQTRLPLVMMISKPFSCATRLKIDIVNEEENSSSGGWVNMNRQIKSPLSTFQGQQLSSRCTCYNKKLFHPQSFTLRPQRPTTKKVISGKLWCALMTYRPWSGRGKMKLFAYNHQQPWSNEKQTLIELFVSEHNKKRFRVSRAPYWLSIRAGNIVPKIKKAIFWS